jgi:copper chaperone CopZ
MTHTYNISGMTCGSCVAKVKSELLKLGDVLSVDIQLSAPQATITMQKHIPVATLQETIAKAGNYLISEASDHPMEHTGAETDGGNSYYPIILIFGYITATTLLVQFSHWQFSWMGWMSDFMAGFFLVFSFFKLMNLHGFAEGYRSYDVVAKKIPSYGYMYPFIELALGVAFLTRFNPLITNTVAFVVMGVSIIGVARSLINKSPFQCACLGTIIKLPLSKLTLFEDVLMVVMSGISLVHILY